MSISFGLSGPQDLLEKVKREYGRLEQAVITNDQDIGDSLFNFCVTCYHIKDWLKASDKLKCSKDNVEKFVENTKELKICKEICNTYKHFKLDRNATTEKVYTSASSTLEGNTSSVLLYGNNYKIKILTIDGDKYEMLDFAKKCINAWVGFFQINF
jgi:hypothetical protein